MKTAEWVLQCIGLYGNGEYLDEIEENFQIELDLASYEVIELIKEYPSNVGNRLAEMMFKMIIEVAVNELNANNEDFDYFCNGSLDTHIYYKQKEVHCWEDIVELANKINNH